MKKILFLLICTTLISVGGTMFTSCSEDDESSNYLDYPYGVTATVKGESIVVSWYKVEGATSYNVYRFDENTYNETLLGNSTTTSYTDKSPLSGESRYVIQAVSGSTKSPYSDYAYVTYTPPLSAPTKITATQSETGIRVSWNKVSSATSYTLTQSTTSTGIYTTVGNNTTDTTMQLTGFTTGTYYFKVISHSYYESSQPSAYASCSYNSDGGTASGLYLGIIGFNEKINSNDFSLLTNSTKNGFTSFVDNMTTKNGTVLYYAVEQALDRLKAATLPNDLVNVSIVTFTDGLDVGSVGWNDVHQGSNEKYLASIGNRIKNDKIKGLNITAYSIGIPGSDVGKDAVSQAQFTANLTGIASTPASQFVKEAKNMNEVKAQFDTIAQSLYKVSSIESLKLNVSQPADGTKMRFTFDVTSQEISSMENSAVYIEGIFNFATRSLTKVVYHGCSSSSGTTVSSVLDNDTKKVDYTFADLKLTSGASVPKDKDLIKHWYIKNGIWTFNSEFKYDPNTATSVEKKSAIIILVLDCSSSLGANDFSSMKIYAKDFINTLLAGSGGSTTIPSAPTGVTATYQSGYGIRVTWNSVSGATGYKVYYSSSANGTYTPFSSTYTSTSISNAERYNGYNYYKVKAVNSYGESAFSSYVSCYY